MSKMTTEQFLSQLGIEVGQEFILNQELERLKLKFIVKNHMLSLVEKHSDGNWYLFILGIEYLLDKEITPLPKYILTEDEKAIVRLAFLGDNVYIYRYCNEDLVIEVNGEDVVLIDDNLFPFVDKEKSISLDDLRKCL